MGDLLLICEPLITFALLHDLRYVARRCKLGVVRPVGTIDDSFHPAPKSAGQDPFVEVVCALQCSGKVQDRVGDPPGCSDSRSQEYKLPGVQKLQDHL